MLDVEIYDCKVIHAEIEDGVKGKKGDKGDQGPPVPLAQDLGDDPNLAVSQKLLKDSIDTMESNNESMVQEAERLNSLSQEAAESAGQSAVSAESAKQAAELSASQASSSELSAAQSALSASSSAAQSAQSASESKDSADQAKISSDESATSAQEALESAQAAKLSEQNALASEQSADLSAQAAAESESNAKTSEQSAASSAQQSADSAVESAAQAVLAGESELAAKGYSEQAGVNADRSEAAADRAEEAATLVEDKLDKSSVKDELGDSKEFVINQSKVTEMFQLFAGWLDLPKADAYADFENNRYFKDGMPCRFEDIFGFERLSEATTFDSDGLEIWGVDEPRVVDGKGLLIEPESTNFLTHNILNILIDSRCTSSYADPSVQITELEGNTTSYYTYRTAPVHDDTVKITDSFYIKKPEFPKMKIGIASVTNPQIDRGQATLFDYDSKEIKASSNSIGSGYSEVGDLTRIWGSANKEFFYDNYLAGAECPTHPSMLEVSYLQRESLGYPSSIIPVQDTPATRLPDILTIPSGYTVSGDYDDGINVDGTQVSGFGYIRKLILEKK